VNREPGAALRFMPLRPTNGQAKRGGLAALMAALREAAAARLVFFTDAVMTIRNF